MIATDDIEELELDHAVGGAIVPRAVDSLLRNFIDSTDSLRTEQLLNTLISDHAIPIIEREVRRKLGSAAVSLGAAALDREQAADLCNDAVVQLLIKLRRIKASPNGAESINDLPGYTAVLAANSCNHFLRRKHPRRHGLKNKLRYLLTRQKGLSLWKDVAGRPVAGYTIWQGQAPTSHREKCSEMETTNASIFAPRLLHSEGRDAHTGELLAAIFDHLGAPVAFDQLVGVVAKLWGLTDRDAEGDDVLEQMPDRRSGADTEAEMRDFLQRLWTEILLLPTRQRMALLLNLAEGQGRGGIEMFPLTGIASLRDLAQSLELSAEQLGEIWNELPWDDARLAENMGLTRQQVINLRKSARARLARRMAKA